MNNKSWENERDIYNFQSHGYNCLIRRHPKFKHLCAYVGVSEYHPLYAHPYGYEGLFESINVHGGLTFADFITENTFENFDYDKWFNETDKKLWWFGFDCGHARDFMPGLIDIGYSEILNRDSIYRDIEYVREECKNLAVQLSKIEFPDLGDNITIRKDTLKSFYKKEIQQETFKKLHNKIHKLIDSFGEGGNNRKLFDFNRNKIQENENINAYLSGFSEGKLVMLNKITFHLAELMGELEKELGNEE